MSNFQSSSDNSYEENNKRQKGTLEGKMYEKLSLSLLANRGYELSKDDSSTFREFAIGREVGIGKDGKFDDIVFSYKDADDAKNLIFVQIKHKQDDYQISSEILSTEASKATSIKDFGHMRRDFNLQKYFISYLNVREEVKAATTSEELKNGRIKYVAILTNIGLNTDDLKSNGFSLRKAPDDIVNLFSVKECKDCYQLVNVSEDLCKMLKKSSDLHRVASDIAQYVVFKNHKETNIMSSDRTPIKHYHVALEKQVIRKSQKLKHISTEKINKKNKTYCEAQFRDDFVENVTIGPKRELKDAIFEAVREIDESKRDMSNDDLKSFLRGIQLKVDKKFGVTKQNSRIDLPSKVIITDEDIKEFLNCLVFIVNQPRVKELETFYNSTTQDSVLKDMSMRQVLDKIENTGPEIKKNVEKVLGIFEKASSKEKWISGEEIKNFIKDQKQQIGMSLIVTAMTLIYESGIMQYGKFKKYGKLSDILNSFLSSNNKIMCVNTSVTLLTSIKILQYLRTEKNFKAEDGRVSVSLDILKYKESRDCLAKAFKLENINLLTIECRHTVTEQDVKELFYKLTDTAKDNNSKKIIFIVQQDERFILAKKFKLDFQIKGLCVQESDSICLKDFQPKEDPLQKKVFMFQEQEEKVSLAQLTGINNWDSYVNCVSQDGLQNKQDVFDITMLDKILNNDEIKIGSKMLGTSSLEGAYATLCEEINAKTFADKLKLQGLDTNVNNIYIISGITGLNKKQKIDKLMQYLGLVDHEEKIEDQCGDVGSDSKIQIADVHFKEESFELFCHDYPEKHIFWISVEHKENKLKFTLQMLYNPTFYLKRKFKNIIIYKDVIKKLMNRNLSEVFIFYCVSNQKELMDSVKFKDKIEKDQFKNNFKNGMIWFFTTETDAKATFKKIQKQNQSQVIHLLKVEEKQFIWCYSHGSVDTLQEYFDLQQSEKCLVEEDNLIKDRKVVIIADDPGMGKTTTLTKLCESKNESNSVIKSHWVIRINLRDHVPVIKDVDLRNNTINISNVVDFLSKIDSKLNHDIAKKLLVIALDKNKNFSKPLLLSFDGFDELLNVDDRNKIISLIKFLKKETAAKLWITTRLHYKQTLEKELATFAIEFDPMNEETKVAYITKYLSDRLWLILSEEKFSELFFSSNEMQENLRIQKYTEAFLNKMKLVFNDNIFRFIGTPLQLYLMLDGSISHFKNWIENDEDQNLNFNYLGDDLWEVYKKFISRKYRIYFEKIGIKGCERENQEKFNLNKSHKDFAKSLIFKSKPQNTFDKFKNVILSAGIIKFQFSSMEFIHTTFRDFFAAKVSIHWIKKGRNELLNPIKQEYLLKEILMKPDFQLIRTFIDVKLGKITDLELPEKTLMQFKAFFEKLLEEQNLLLCKEGTALHIAIEESNANIVCFLLNCLKKYKKVLQKFLFSHYKFKSTTLHLACEKDDVKVVRVLLDAAAGISSNVQQKFIYSLIGSDTNALDDAVLRSNNVEILKLLLARAKSKLDLIMNPKKRYNSLNLACEYGNEEFVMCLLQEFKNDENSIKQVLLHNDRHGNALYWAIGFTIIVKNLLSIAKSLKDNNETLKSLLLPKNGELPLNAAIPRINVEVIEILLHAAKDINDDNITLKQLLLNDERHESALWDAAVVGDCSIIKLLLKTAASLDSGFLENLIFAVDRDNNNAIHLIVKNGHEEIYDDSFKILEEDRYEAIQKKVKDTFNKIPLVDRLHAAKTELIRLVSQNRISEVRDILNSAKNSNEKLRILLLASHQTECTCNTLYIACEYGFKDLVKELLSYAINIDDGGATITELITSSGFNNKTPFEALKNGYTIEIKQIIESLIHEARKNNNEHAANILQDINEKYSDVNSASLE